MKTRKINPFLIAYVVALVALASLGYFLSDFAIKNQKEHEALSKRHFATDVAFLELPRINTALVSTRGTSSQLRLDIALEVEQKNMAVLEGIQPYITDKIITYVRHMDADEMHRSSSVPRLHQELLRQVNSLSPAAPVLDVVFRQLVFM